MQHQISNSAPTFRVHSPQTRAISTFALPGAMLLFLLGIGGYGVSSLVKAPPQQQTLAAFSTSLKGRNRNQRLNAELAARSLDGRLIGAYRTFSFNETVKSWSVDQGYVKALVSYDGEMVRAYGGGVCQTSTTLYNAVLLAGLPVLERHPHVFVPGYSAPGRDAAVAFPGIDLRFKNPHSFPIRLRARAVGDRLEVAILGAKRSSTKVSIHSEMLSVAVPQRLTRIVSTSHSRARRIYLHNPGARGYRVVTSRVLTSGKNTRRETLSDDTYPAMNRVVALSRSAD